MADLVALWSTSFRKEAMDTLAGIWPTLDDGGRNKLAAALLEGPPAPMLEHLEPDARARSRDRRIFERIMVIERLGKPLLNPNLAEHLAELKKKYPEWEIEEGERAHFGTWFEMRSGDESQFSVDDLLQMPSSDLLERLCVDTDRREGLLDTWQQLVTAQPQHAVSVLEQLAGRSDPGPVDVWEHALIGLRKSEGAELLTNEIVLLLANVPNKLFAKHDMIRAAAELLESTSRKIQDQGESDQFWLLFDRALKAASEDRPQPANDEHQPRDWVDEAVSQPLGAIATSFINVLFARRPIVGGKLPKDLVTRADELIARGDTHHRTARVIGASRISYLYAIDPEWAADSIIPSFDWSDEEESIAMWQGYAWQARIDPQLWAALKPHFFSLFSPGRLERMGQWGTTIAQSLMLVGVVFEADELKRDATRNAIRAMSDELRIECAAWIADYMEAAELGDQDDNQEDGQHTEASPDARWERRVWPWLKRVWPVEASLKSAGTAEHFALAAIATDSMFPEAVKSVLSLATKGNGDRILHKLNDSAHPELHPGASLALLDAFVVRDPNGYVGVDIGKVIDRIGATDEKIRGSNSYRRWREFVAQRRS